ncbi:hypothetical protein PGT21_006048 [Puccinia graminis f. sp. tritici]|uniref:Uncharacterized protein n=1 Tax=Puccinia graminis f. sp. tritici TaxID=56615 RepID=A0A5B0MVM9_PUCGR|nr:hypothetical protein PGT21_006048 [Puccinia graminis f. sp. tritici]KAA1120442.1 hypothetical protein PGTUg99_019322 [Puccinia graminis f. sp. tritici]
MSKTRSSRIFRCGNELIDSRQVGKLYNLRKLVGLRQLVKPPDDQQEEGFGTSRLFQYRNSYNKHFFKKVGHCINEYLEGIYFIPWLHKWDFICNDP